MTQNSTEQLEVTVNWNGNDYTVGVTASVTTESWDEHHGPGLNEPMSERTIDDVEIRDDQDYPDETSFFELVREKVEDELN